MNPHHGLPFLDDPHLPFQDALLAPAPHRRPLRDPLAHDSCSPPATCGPPTPLRASAHAPSASAAAAAIAGSPPKRAGRSFPLARIATGVPTTVRARACHPPPPGFTAGGRSRCRSTAACAPRPSSPTCAAWYGSSTSALQICPRRARCSMRPRSCARCCSSGNRCHSSSPSSAAPRRTSSASSSS